VTAMEAGLRQQALVEEAEMLKARPERLVLERSSPA
jgi:hypothetical protein